MPRFTSIVTVCMNRREHLLETAPRVAAWPHHREHLIVDWSSVEPLRRRELPDDPRIRLLRVEGERRWNLCRAYNFALHQARGDCLFKLDADGWPEDLAEPDSLAVDGVVCCFGSGEDGRLGQFVIDRGLVEQVGGFNEYLWGYGFDDKDLKARLQGHAGAVIHLLPPRALGVIAHSIEYRASRAHRADVRPGPLEEGRSHALKRATSMANRVLAASCPWSHRSAPSRYLHDPLADVWHLVPDSLPRPPEGVRQELIRLRRHQFWGRFLMIPEVVVMELPVKLLPKERQGDFPVRWWHRLYWHTIRRAFAWPVHLLTLLKGRLRQLRRRVRG